MKAFVRPADCRKLLFVFCCWLVALSSGIGAQRTWDGGGNDWDWRNAVNWDGTIIRPNPIDQGDTLVFPAGPTKLINTNDFGPGTNFTALIYSGSGYASYGSSIGLSNGISVTHASGSTTLFLPITLREDQSFTVSSASSTLILSGDINIGLNTLTFDGAGNFVTIGEILDGRFGRNSVVKNGTGRLTIFQQTDHNVPTIVNGGTLAVENRMTNSAVTVNAGGTLRGSGRIGALDVNSGGVVQPGGTTPDSLDCYGDINLEAGSVFRVRLNGTSPGLNYDQLKVIGGVTLGGTLEVTAGFIPAVGDRFVIIDNDGSDAVVGDFAGLSQNAVFTVNGRSYQIHYGRGIHFEGNDVTLEVVPGTSIWDGGGNLNKFWSEPLNWVGDMAPLPGDNVQFTATGPLLRTVNDLPATHPIGTIILISGDHRIEGNLPRLDGGIQVNPGVNDTNRVPRHIEILAPIVLGANQSIEMNYTNSFLDLKGAIDLGNSDLTVYTESVYSLGSTAYSQISIFGGISGAGTLIKNGPGNISLLSPSTCGHTIVNGGRFRMDASSSSSAPITGSVTVNSGVFDVGDEVGGDVTVNANGLLEGIWSSIAGNVEINGGTFRPWYPIYSYKLIDGNLRMINGANYIVGIRDSDYGPRSDGAAVGGTVELADCNLSLSVGTTFLPGQGVSVVSHAQNGRTGMFNGLPQGTRFMAGGQAFMIDYQAFYVLLIGNPPFVWSGGGIGGRWSTAANWTGNFAPFPGSPLEFPSGVAKLNVTNDLAGGTAIYWLTFTGPSYSLYGNALAISAAVSNSITSGQTLVQADLNFQQNNLPVAVESNSVLRLEGLLSGGSIRKFGTGTLRLGGSAGNTFAGAEVWGGELELGKSGANALNGAVRIGDGTNSAMLSLLADNQIADSADVTVKAPARLVLNNYIDAIDGLSGDGTIVLNAAFPTPRPRLTVNSGNFSGNMTGSGGLTKEGSGFLTLNGDNSFSGVTILAQGTLSIDGVLANSPLRLDGGTLTGRGQINGLTADSGGAVSPGTASPNFQNALHCGNVSFNSSVSFRPTLTSVDPGYENSYLQVAGTVSLGNAELRLGLAGSFVPPANKAFVIINNDGTDAVVGTFAGLPEGAIVGGRGFAFRISYVGGTGNDVTVTRVPAPPADFSSIQTLGNGRFLMQGEAINGLEYNIQAASNLNPVINWVQVGRSTGNSSGIFQFIHSNSPAIRMRFYRAVTP